MTETLIAAALIGSMVGGFFGVLWFLRGVEREAGEAERQAESLRHAAEDTSWLQPERPQWAARRAREQADEMKR